MTIEAAEAFYKKYQGRAFHMGREEPCKYEYFKRLELPESCLAQWDEDLLNTEFEKLWTESNRVWVRHGNILEILFRRRCDTEAWVTRLLDEMDKMGRLGRGCRTHIIENMAGRTDSRKDGGVCFICTRTRQEDRMKTVMVNVIGDRNSDDRSFLEAIRNYENALNRYGK